MTGAKTYYYVVTPADASGDGAKLSRSFRDHGSRRAGNVTVTAGNGQATLNWSASTGATGYSVLRATSLNWTYTMVASGLTGTTYTDTGLANGTTYYYAVVATNGSGSSANSTQVERDHLARRANRPRRHARQRAGLAPVELHHWRGDL